MSPRVKEPTKGVTIRLPLNLIKRFDTIAERLNERQGSLLSQLPSQHWTRTEAMRLALLQGADAIEEKLNESEGIVEDVDEDV